MQGLLGDRPTKRTRTRDAYPVYGVESVTAGQPGDNIAAAALLEETLGQRKQLLNKAEHTLGIHFGLEIEQRNST